MSGPATELDVGTKSANTCPSCGQKGRPVGHKTLEALVSPSLFATLTGGDGFRFCRTNTCDVAYYHPQSGQTIPLAAVTVEIFQKSRAPNRLVCYCFDHRVDSIRKEVLESNDSQVPASITAKCREGLDRCEETNPQGSCCLGNVRQVVKDAQLDGGEPMFPKTGHIDADHCEISASTDEPTIAHSCCSARPSESGLEAAGVAYSADPNLTGPAMVSRFAGQRGAARTGILTSSGALLAAILSSACCWIPLALVGFGASTVGIAGFFEAYRTHLLVVTGLLLAGGFYVIYLRKPTCAPGDACARPNPRLQRFNKLILWMTTGLVLAFASFPNYLTYVTGGGSSGLVEAAESRAYSLEGMTCEGCAGNIRTAIAKIPGIQAVDVSYPKKQALVQVLPGAAVSDEVIVQAVKSLGYEATPTRAIPPSTVHVLQVQGMTCEGCAANIRKAIEAVPGVAAADVSYADKRARVQLEQDADVSDATLLEAVAKAGYEAQVAVQDKIN